MNMTALIPSDSLIMLYCSPCPIDNGTLTRSGEIVDKFQGPTLSCGLGGSERICRLAFLKDCPTVSIPIW